MTTAELRPKLIYLTRRHPALTRTGFTPRWREHGALGMSRPRWSNIARYTHGDVLEPPAALRDVLSDHDGIGLIWHRSPAHRAAHLADTTSRGEMEADELATFAEPIVRHCLLARETILIPPPSSTDIATKLTCFHWASEREALRRADSTKQSGVSGHVINEPLPPERPGGWGLSCDLVEELWFDSRAAAVCGAQILSAATKRVRPDGRTVMVLSNEVELYRATGE